MPKAKQPTLSQHRDRLQTRARDVLGELLQDPNLPCPIRKLFELSEHPDVQISLIASRELAKLIVPPKASIEERVDFRLPKRLSTPADIDAALSLVAEKTASGELPTKQSEQICRILALRLDAHSQINISRRIETIEQHIRSAPAVDGPTYRRLEYTALS